MAVRYYWERDWQVLRHVLRWQFNFIKIWTALAHFGNISCLEFIPQFYMILNRLTPKNNLIIDNKTDFHFFFFQLRWITKVPIGLDSVRSLATGDESCYWWWLIPTGRYSARYFCSDYQNQNQKQKEVEWRVFLCRIRLWTFTSAPRDSLTSVGTQWLQLGFLPKEL